jgi:hypothetical protein
MLGNIVDHEGRHFKSEALMCRHHSVESYSYSYYKNKYPGKSSAEILQDVLSENSTYPIVSNELKLTGAVRGIPYDKLSSRKKLGWADEEILEEAGRGLVIKIGQGRNPNQLLNVLSSPKPYGLRTTEGCKKVVHRMFNSSTKVAYFLVQILATGKYSIMNADEILGFDGTDPELLFDNYIWD